MNPKQDSTSILQEIKAKHTAFLAPRVTIWR